MLKRTLLGLLLIAGLSSVAPAETRTYAVPETDRETFDASLKAMSADLIARENGITLLSNGREIHASGEPGLLDQFGERLKRIDTRIAQVPADPSQLPRPRGNQPGPVGAGRQVPSAQPAGGADSPNNPIKSAQDVLELQKKIRSETLGRGPGPLSASAMAERVTQVYRVHHPAADVANTLRGLFADSSIVAEQQSNSLLVAATPSDAPIIEALVRQIDVAPARVQVSVLVAELSGATEAWEPKGTWDEASRELEAMAAKGAGSILRRIRLSTLNNQIASVQMGETVNILTGKTISPRGEIPSYQATQVGTMLTCTPRTDPDGQVTMELAFEMSRLAPAAPKGAAGPGTSETPSGPSASSLAGPQRQTATVRTTVSIPKGKAVSISDFATQDAGAPSRLILVVGCEVQ